MAEVVVGLQELQDKLEELAFVVREEALVAALTEGATILVEEASRRAPRDTGALARFMTMKILKAQSDASSASARVGPAKKQFYGRFVEDGTKYMRPKPYLRPALEANRERIIRAMGEALKHYIESVAA